MDGDTLVGGLYGVLLDKVFFGESMFSLESNGSKFAFVALDRICCAGGVQLVDCQIHSPHLESLGARSISRGGFEKKLREAINMPMTSILEHPSLSTPSSVCSINRRLQCHVPTRVSNLQ